MDTSGPAGQFVQACPPGLRCKTRSQDEAASSPSTRRSNAEDTAAPLSPRLELLRDQLGQAFINWQVGIPAPLGVLLFWVGEREGPGPPFPSPIPFYKPTQCGSWAVGVLF